MRIIEVGPRDGLQNEATPIPTDAKLRFIAALAAAGMREIEVTSFVSPKWVPQLADADGVWRALPPGAALYSALVPNRRGLARAMEVGVARIALFTAASDEFTRRNIAMSVDESLAEFGATIAEFRAAVPAGWVRGYVSTAFECPYAGRISPDRVAQVAERLFALGVNEVSLGDTIGVAVPREVRALAGALSSVPPERIAWHFHDTRGTAIANVSAALELGYAAFDASAGGLGGCPFAPGAGGNLATEDLVYFLERSGIPTGVRVDRLAKATDEVFSLLGRSPTAKSRCAAAGAAARSAT